ncbi:MAG: outer membrane protein assembly factor BamB family protein [Pirellulaceae bacterium]
MRKEQGPPSLDAAAPTAGESPAAGRKLFGMSIPRGMRVVVQIAWVVFMLGCLVGIILLRLQAGAMDYATANVLTLVLCFLAVLAVLVRWLLRSDLHWSWRWLPILGVVLAVVASGLLLRIDRVSGRLVPKLVFRWSPKPDQLLAPMVIYGIEVAVDVSTTTPNDFPQFLGPQRNLIVTGVELERDWVAHPPRLLWRQPIGAGWSGFSAVNGFAMTLEQRGDQELVTCYEVATGNPCWSHAVTARHETIAGGVGPRSTPTIDEGLVYALGATGVLRCLDGRSGTPLWQDDILQRYGVTPEQDLRAVMWGRSASPLVVGDLLIVPFGGPVGGPCASLAAYDKLTGELRWKCGEWQVSYASPTLANLCGTPQVVIVNEATVSGHRPEDGSVWWSFPWPGGSASNASVSQAVAVSDNRVLLSKDYGIGSALIELTAVPAGPWLVRELWAKPGVLKTKFTNVVIRDGFAYGLSDGILECVEIETGERRWKERRGGNFGHGQILLVGDVLLVQAESGEVVMLEANANKLVELGRFAALSDQTWNNLCLYGPYLLVRNAVEAACYELPRKN